MPAPLDFTQKINHALSHLYDPDILRKHPLLRIFGLSTSPNAPTLLREKLIKAIEALKPSEDIPTESRAWRIYKILFKRYVQQMDQNQTAFQIGVGVRHLRREQSVAVSALADMLHQNLAPLGVAALQEDAASPEADPVAGEFAWLQKDELETTTHLHDMVQVILQLVEPLASAKGIVLENQVSSQIPQALISPAAIRQTLISMTTHAIHRLASGRIVIQAVLVEQRIEMTVLAVSAISLTPENSESQESLRSIQLLLGKHSSNLAIEEDEGRFEYRLRLPAERSINVLMIDDNKDVADLFKRYVYETSIHIELLADPAQVFATCEQLQPKIILLDIMIPHIDGWELLGRIRQHPLTQQIPIIVCSALPERELAMALGAAAYLHKPVTRSELLDALKQVMSE